MKLQATVGLIATMMFSCGKEQNDKRQLPQRSASQEASPTQPKAEFNLISDSNPAPKLIEMDITRNHKDKKSGSGIVYESYCPGKLPEDFVIGKAVCASDNTLNYDITAGHTRQVCMGQTYEPTKKIEVPGCESLGIDWIEFDDGVTLRVL